MGSAPLSPQKPPSVASSALRRSQEREEQRQKNGSRSTNAAARRRALEALRQGDLYGRLQTYGRGAARVGCGAGGRRALRECQAQEEVGRPALLLHGRRRGLSSWRRRLVRQVHGEHRAAALTGGVAQVNSRI